MSTGNVDIVNVDQHNIDIGHRHITGAPAWRTVDGASASELTAKEVADMMGVKRQTIYAYVSRGILHRRVALDGRTSVFDRIEVEELMRGGRDDRDGEIRTLIATRLTRVADEGIWIRGRDLVGAVEAGAGFTDVADLLWEAPATERWPNLNESSEHGDHGQPGIAVFPHLTGQSLDGCLLEQLRVLVATESSRDPLRHDLAARSVRAAGRSAIGAMVTGLRTSIDAPPAARNSTLSQVLWNKLSADQTKGTTLPHRQLALDSTLALLADHGLATSTFAARVAASVRADPYSVIAAGLGALGGPLHGQASMQVHRMYEAVEREGNVAQIIGDLQREGGAMPGFGHSIYTSQDPRYGALLAKITQGWADDPRLQIVFQVRDLIGSRSNDVPNVDLAIGALTYIARMPPHAGEVLFAIARTAGWIAHAMEEYDERPLRFRPKASYIGAQPAR